MCVFADNVRRGNNNTITHTVIFCKCSKMQLGCWEQCLYVVATCAGYTTAALKFGAIFSRFIVKLCFPVIGLGGNNKDNNNNNDNTRVVSYVLTTAAVDRPTHIIVVFIATRQQVSVGPRLQGAILISTELLDNHIKKQKIPRP